MALSNVDTDKACGLYIDAENLQNDAQALVKILIDDWPIEKAPHPTKVNLYVRADTVELWNAWTASIGGEIAFEVKGIQHFTLQQSKNSADIALVLDAFCDFIHREVCHVAVLSDDSDFISLFAKIRTEAPRVRPETDGIPFLWVMTDRNGTRTPNVQKFFPPEYIHFVQFPQSQNNGLTIAVSSPGKTEGMTEGVGDTGVQPDTTEERIAWAIIRERPLGTFKSTDCRDIVKRADRKHRLGGLPDNQFGKLFLDTVWPHLKSKGVKLKSQKPNRYEITDEAKTVLAANG